MAKSSRRTRSAPVTRRRRRSSSKSRRRPRSAIGLQRKRGNGVRPHYRIKQLGLNTFAKTFKL